MSNLITDSMKPEPKIEKIKITKRQLDEIASLLKKESLTTEFKNRVIKAYAGGVCAICGGIPTKKIIYDADGATIIERYCDKCFKKGF